MGKTNSFEQKTYFQKKISVFWNATTSFLRIIIVINIGLLLTLLVIQLADLIFHFFPPQKNESKHLFNIPSWLIFIITFLGSVFNLISIVLMFYKKKVTFIWGLLAVICLGLKHLSNELWGLVIIYWGYYVISQIILFFWWGKKINNDKKIIVRHGKIWEFILICSLLIAISIIFMLVRLKVPAIQKWLLTDDKQPHNNFVVFLDSFILSFALSVVYFVAKRYVERWIISLIVDSAQVILYIILVAINISDAEFGKILSNIIFLIISMTLLAVAWYSWIKWNKDSIE